MALTFSDLQIKPQAAAGQNVRTAAHADHKLWTCTSNGLAQYDAIADVFRKAHIPGTMSTEDMIQIYRYTDIQFQVPRGDQKYILYI